MSGHTIIKEGGIEMPVRNIVIMSGDGIGKIVLPEALRVLDAVGFKANYIPAEIGFHNRCG